MRQLSLFEADSGGLPNAGAPAPAAAGDPATSFEPPGPGLFDRPVMLRTELDADIEAGRFEAARNRYLELAHVWRESKNAEPAAFLAALDPSMFFSRSSVC